MIPTPFSAEWAEEALCWMVRPVAPSKAFLVLPNESSQSERDFYHGVQFREEPVWP